EDGARLGRADRRGGLGCGRRRAGTARPPQAQGVQPEAGAHDRDGEGGRPVGEDPEQLEREIEATRAKLGQDIDALEEKINPKKVAKVRDKVAGKATEAKQKMQNGGSAGTGDQKGLADTVKEKAGPLVGTAREKAQPLMDKAAPVAQQVKEKAAVRAGLDPQTADTKQVATTIAGESWVML